MSQREDMTPCGQSGGHVFPTSSQMETLRLRKLKPLTQPAACDFLPCLPWRPVADGETEFYQVLSTLLYRPGAVSPQAPCEWSQPSSTPSASSGRVSLPLSYCALGIPSPTQPYWGTFSQEGNSTASFTSGWPEPQALALVCK